MLDYFIAAFVPSRRRRVAMKTLRSLSSVDGALLLEGCKAANIKTIGVNYLGKYRVSLDVNGKSITEETLSFGSFQYSLFEVFSNHVDVAGLAFVNVGANIGTSCLNAHAIGFRDIIAFEPVEENYSLLAQNLRQLGEEVHLHQCGAGEEKCVAEINLNLNSMGRHSLVKNFGQGTQEIEIVRLDDVLPARSGVLWIDTEGYEVNVLRGARNYLESHAVAMCVEITPGLLGNDLAELFAIMRQNFTRFFSAAGNEVAARDLELFVGSEQKDVIAIK